MKYTTFIFKTPHGYSFSEYGAGPNDASIKAVAHLISQGLDYTNLQVQKDGDTEWKTVNLSINIS